jgi:DNA-binding transcriptional LysR family regulator
LKTRQIVLLVYLDQCGSVLRAAEATGMTQPAASKLLRDLEGTFGVPLFDRGARGVTPTWYGEVLIRHARSALAEISRAQDEIATLQSGSTGEVRIGTLLNPGTNLVPMAVARLKQLQPRILVTIDVDDSQPLIEKLLKGELDLMVGRIPGWRDVAELEAESLADERHAVIASTRHPFADRNNLRLEDLAGHGWILPSPGSPLRDRLLSQFMDRDLPAPNNVVESSSLPVITNLQSLAPRICPARYSFGDLLRKAFI